jgi:putative membrane protein
MRLVQSLIHTKWTKSNIAWAIAFIYTLYVALGAIPPFKGNIAFSVSSAGGVLVLLYFFHSFTTQNVKLASKFLVIAATISYLWEFIGVETGIPFGQYVYTSALGPMIGPVPIFIPLLWCALGYFCLQASDYYIVASALMVSLDLSFDPVFSTSLHLWIWQSPAQYFGVPLSNFFGWFIASLTFFAIFSYITRHSPRASKNAMAFYYLFGLDNVVGDLVSGSPALAASSFAIFTLATMIIFMIHKRKETKTKVSVTVQVPNVSRQPVSSGNSFR